MSELNFDLYYKGKQQDVTGSYPGAFVLEAETNAEGKPECRTGNLMFFNNDGQLTYVNEGLIAREIAVMDCSTGLSYQFDETNSTCIVKGIGTCRDLFVKVPAYVDGYAVKEVDVSCFQGCDVIGIELPETITHVHDNAFEGTNYLIYVKFNSIPVLGHQLFNESDIQYVVSPNAHIDGLLDTLHNCYRGRENVKQVTELPVKITMDDNLIYVDNKISNRYARDLHPESVISLAKQVAPHSFNHPGSAVNNTISLKKDMNEDVVISNSFNDTSLHILDIDSSTPMAHAGNIKIDSGSFKNVNTLFLPASSSYVNLELTEPESLKNCTFITCGGYESYLANTVVNNEEYSPMYPDMTYRVPSDTLNVKQLWYYTDYILGASCGTNGYFFPSRPVEFLYLRGPAEFQRGNTPSVVQNVRTNILDTSMCVDSIDFPSERSYNIYVGDGRSGVIKINSPKFIVANDYLNISFNIVSDGANKYSVTDIGSQHLSYVTQDIMQSSEELQGFNPQEIVFDGFNYAGLSGGYNLLNGSIPWYGSSGSNALSIHIFNHKRADSLEPLHINPLTLFRRSDGEGMSSTDFNKAYTLNIFYDGPFEDIHFDIPLDAEELGSYYQDVNSVLWYPYDYAHGATESAYGYAYLEVNYLTIKVYPNKSRNNLPDWYKRTI